MRKLTQKLVLSVVTMALVVVALGTSTFAWFTLQNTAVIGQVQADVTAGEGIEVSLGSWVLNNNGTAGDTSDDFYEAQLLSTSTWYTTIAGSVLQARLNDMYSTALSLTDVTSTNGRLMQKRDAAGNLSTVGKLSGSYIEFPLWFRSGSENTITLENLVISGTETKIWTVDIPFVGANTNQFSTGEAFTEGETFKVAAWTAARVSFSNPTEEAGLATVISKTYQRAAVPGTSFTDTVYNSDVLPSVSYALNAQFGAASYYAAKSGTPIVAPASTIIPDATKLALNGNVTPASSLVVLESAGTGQPYLGNVTVRIWIEGWDADLFDAIFSTRLYISMRFGVL